MAGKDTKPVGALMIGTGCLFGLWALDLWNKPKRQWPPPREGPVSQAPMHLKRNTLSTSLLIMACRMEHFVPKAIVDRFVKYSEYVEKCPKGGIYLGGRLRLLL